MHASVNCSAMCTCVNHNVPALYPALIIVSDLGPPFESFDRGLDASESLTVPLLARLRCASRYTSVTTGKPITYTTRVTIATPPAARYSGPKHVNDGCDATTQRDNGWSYVPSRCTHLRASSVDVQTSG